MIWATRGKYWGFRFLDRGGFDDPLPEYDAVFTGVEGRSEVCRRVGRVIPHDFVLFPPLADQVHSVQDGIRLVWNLPQVIDEFERVWALAKPPQDN